MTGGWEDSAAAWIADMGDGGDWGRKHVLDPPMLQRVSAAAPRSALDVGCGEGRFCRMLREAGVATVGIDPTLVLIEHARRSDPAGDYRVAGAEALPFDDGQFDLVVSYLSLIDIPDIATAIAEMGRVLRPGGRLLIANLTSFNTAGLELGWTRDAHGRPMFGLDGYLEERAVWCSWRGIKVQNWHRPLSAYMGLLLEQGLTLTHFAEPEPTGDDAADIERYRRAPWFMIMEWRKP
jgi:SAM-dependent methyltransferase